MAVAIEGPLNREALRASLQALVARHAILQPLSPLTVNDPLRLFTTSAPLTFYFATVAIAGPNSA